MPFFNVTLTGNSDWNVAEILDGARWTKHPELGLGFSAVGINLVRPPAPTTALEVTNKRLAFGQKQGSFGTITVALQVETDSDRLALRLDKGGIGTLRIKSPVDERVNDRTGGGQNPLDVTLFLGPPALPLAESGARGLAGPPSTAVEVLAAGGVSITFPDGTTRQLPIVDADDELPTTPNPVAV